MSCSRGSNTRTRPQKHQNRTVFKNSLHDTSKKTKFLNSLQVTGVCERCKEIIEWKIKYKKYKLLTAPGKCVSCQQKNVKHAYHVMCFDCAKTKKVCTKCCKPYETVVNPEGIDNETKFHSILINLPERKRRTVLRHLKKKDTEGIEVNPSDIHTLLQEIGKLDLDSDSTEEGDSDVDN